MFVGTSQGQHHSGTARVCNGDPTLGTTPSRITDLANLEEGLETFSPSTAFGVQRSGLCCSGRCRKNRVLPLDTLGGPKGSQKQLWWIVPINPAAQTCGTFHGRLHRFCTCGERTALAAPVWRSNSESTSTARVWGIFVRHEICMSWRDNP